MARGANDFAGFRTYLGDLAYCAARLLRVFLALAPTPARARDGAKTENVAGYIMDVLAIPELVDKILAGCYSTEIRLIAKLRMVCRFCRDLFKTVVGTETRTRCGITYAATTYSVRRIFGCSKYLHMGGPQQRNPPLQRIHIGAFDTSCTTEYSDVIHVQEREDYCCDYIMTGFELIRADFVAINRLFGIAADSYRLLLAIEHNQSGNPIMTFNRLTNDTMQVEYAGGIHEMTRYAYLDKKDGCYYQFIGQIFWSAADIGNFDCLERLHRLTW